MHARLVLITLHSMSVQGGGAGGSLCTERSMSSLKGPCDRLAPGQPRSSHFVQKISCWKRSLTLPAIGVWSECETSKAVVLLGSAGQVCALPGHGALSFCCRGAKKSSRCFAWRWCRHPLWEPCSVEQTGSRSKCGRG